MTGIGEDHIPFIELKQRLEVYDEAQKVLEKLSRHDEEMDPIVALMISFFFKGGREELGAEFTHKSFREYLYAEAVVEAVKEYARHAPPGVRERDDREFWKEFSETDPRWKLSRRLGRLLAPQWVTPDIGAHLRNLLDWEIAGSSALGNATNPARLSADTSHLTPDQWARAREALADLWDWWGEGVHMRPQPQMRGAQFRELEPRMLAYELVDWCLPQDVARRVPGPRLRPMRVTAVDGILGDGLFRLCALVHGRLREHLPTGPQPEYPRRYQELDDRGARFKPSGEGPTYFANYIARINAVGWRPEGPFPRQSYMAHVSLPSCALYHKDFTLANLSHAALCDTDFSGSTFFEANLRETDFSRCHLIDSWFGGADFTAARFLHASVSPDVESALRAKGVEDHLIRAWTFREAADAPTGSRKRPPWRE